MVKLLVVFGVVIVIIVGLFTLFNQNSKDTLTFTDVQASMSDGSSLLDVREADEYQEGHIKGAINLPLSQIQTGSFGDLTKDKPHYVYCRSGNRSAQATEILQTAGYKITDLGAMDSVAQIGGTVCKSC